MKKVLLLLFTAACFAVCVVPSVGMIFNPTTEIIGNEQKTELPSVTNEDGSVNLEYMSGLGEYFGKHFAFRPQAINADANIQSGIFKTSNLSSVIVGNSGWLYYSSTANDFTGRKALSDAEVAGVVNNLRLLQEYSEANGAQFLFTIAPNKNTLYPDNMPYTYTKAGSVFNRDTVSAALEESEVNYLNLFKVFYAQNETLYFARDSHWNNKGALLAYNSLTDALGKSHEDYQGARITKKKDFTGDLAKMIYPAGSEPEYNYYYGAEDKYTYTTETESVEEPFIQTACDSASGTLYMYRDSFGNALLPFFAGTYGNATFTKSFPMILDRDFESVKPDAFVMEIAERNISWFIERPPVMLSPEVSIFKTDGDLGEKPGIVVSPCEYSPDYVAVSGTLNEKYSEAQAVYVTVKTAAGSKTRECYTVFEDGKRKYLAYFDSDEIDMSADAEVSAIIKTGEETLTLGAETIDIGGTK